MDKQTRYRMVLAGELAEDWSSWFDAAQVTTAHGRTTLELVVADQAALHGILKRVHALHLKLISLDDIGEDNENR